MQFHHQALTFVKRFVRSSGPTPEPLIRPQTILVVDDEDAILKLVERILTKAGCRTVIAHDGAEAVSVAATLDRLDVLVTDLMMPAMNGDELARRLRTIEPDLPVLYLTGFSDRLFADRMQLWEREAFLDKPCSVTGLLEAIALISGRPMDSLRVPTHDTNPLCMAGAGTAS